MTQPRVVLIGAVESTRVALDLMCDSDCPPELLITLPVDRSAIHSDFVDLPSIAGQRGVKTMTTANVNDETVIEQVRALRPDFLFVIGWSRLVGEALRGCATKGVLGYHPAPLPKGRGRSALSWTILLGLRETAGTLFWIDEGIDAGPIAAQASFELPTRIDLPGLYAQHMDALRHMLRDLLEQLKKGHIPAEIQDQREATYYSQRKPADGWIDWSAEAGSIDRLVRAVTRPYPGAFTSYAGNKMIIWRGEPVEKPEWHAQIGQIFLIENGALYVRCGAGTSYRIDEFEIRAVPGQEPPTVKGQPRLGSVKGEFHA